MDSGGSVLAVTTVETIPSLLFNGKCISTFLSHIYCPRKKDNF